MIFVADARELASVLEKVQPSVGRYKSLKESVVLDEAKLNVVTFRGTLSATSSLAVQVISDGIAPVPLATTLKVLKTYKKGTKVTVHSEPGALGIDRLKLRVGDFDLSDLQD